MKDSKTLSSYISELETAWNIAYQKTKDQVEANETPTALVDCIHYALLQSSLNTFAENLTPKIVARLYATDLWTIEDILTLVSIIPDNYRKAQNYIALLETGKLNPEFSISMREIALQTAETIDFQAYRSRILEELSKFSESDDKIAQLEQAVDAHIASADGMFGRNAFSLCQLINELPDQMLKSTEQKLLALQNSEARAWTLAFLARRTGSDHQYRLLSIGLDAASQIESDVNIANALAQLGSQLSGELVPKALDLALSLKEGNWRPRAVAGLVDKVDERQMKRVLESMLEIDDDWWRADGLMSVIEHSSGETQIRALQNLLSIENGEPYSKMIGWLIHFVTTQDNIETATRAAIEITNEQHRSKILERLNRVKDDKKDENQVLSFPSLIDERNQFITAKNTIYDRVEDIFLIEWEEDRANALSYVAASIPDDLIALVVDRSKRFLSWLHRDVVLNRLAPRLSGEVLSSAIQDVADYEDTTSLAHILKELAKYLPQPQRNILYSYALDELLAENSPKWAADEVLKLRADLDGELRAKATARLPEELRNTTYEELSAQRHATLLKQFDENPDSKKQFNDMMEAARQQYAPEQITLPQIVKPIESLKIPDENQKLHDDRIDFLTSLDEIRFKKREEVFWLFGNIPTLFKEYETSAQIISAIATDILEIHKKWHWPQ